MVGFHNDLTPGKQGEQGPTESKTGAGEEVCRELSFGLNPAVQLLGEMAGSSRPPT